jgi:mono/diheme cytochrome c family protein
VKRIVFLACLVAVRAGSAIGQEPPKSVAAGVYTDAQADRGAVTYDTSCSGCHRSDLRGGSGPALTGERFTRVYAGKDLKALFTKISTTMPRGDAGGLGEDVYLDVIAHVLRENGFPAGPQELDTDALDGVEVLPSKAKPPPPIGDFSYVEVVGCLMPGPQGAWMLTRASAPAAAEVSPRQRPAAGSPSSIAPLGVQTFRLIDAVAYAPAAHKGHKMFVRGLLVRLHEEQRISISAFEMLSPVCAE